MPNPDLPCRTSPDRAMLYRTQLRPALTDHSTPRRWPRLTKAWPAVPRRGRASLIRAQSPHDAALAVGESPLSMPSAANHAPTVVAVVATP